MAWQSVGSATAADGWVQIPQPLTSDVIRVSYDAAFPAQIFVEGYLRLLWDLNTYGYDWYRLYPKGGISEVYRLDFLLPADGSYPRIEIRRRRSGQSAAVSWSIFVEEWR